MRNFFNVGLRLFKTSWFFSSLNILGVCIGITGIILLYIFVDSENSFDKFHKDYSQIYRLTSIFNQHGKESRFALNDGLWDDVLVTDVPGVAYSTAFSRGGLRPFSADGKNFHSAFGLMSDADFLKVFDFKIISGSSDFSNPNNIILTRNLAIKLFGVVNVSGKLVEVKTETDKQTLVVSAVIENVPLNSSIHFQFVIRGQGPMWEQRFEKVNRTGNTLHIYFKTADQQDLSTLQTNVDLAFAKHMFPGNPIQTPVQPLSDIHFNSNNQFELQAGGNKDYVNIFTFIITGFLFITLVNSSSIHSSQFFKRLKEVGVRKLLGCSKYKLGKLFIFDAILTLVLCTSCAAVLAYIILLKTDLSTFSIEPSTFLQPHILTRILVGSFVLGLLIGIYPAVQVSAIETSKALKGRFVQTRERLPSIRSSIITVQILSAAIMFSLSLVVIRQINLLTNTPLGIDKNNVLCIYRSQLVSTVNWRSFQEQLKTERVITAVGSSGFRLLGNLNTAQFSGDQRFLSHWFAADADFFETMQIKILEGRDFTQGVYPGPYEALINEKARQEFNADRDPIGTSLSSWFGDYRIVGIVSDFHFRSFNSKVTPLVIVLGEESNWVAYARYEPGKHKEALEAAQKIWNKFEFGESLQFEFFDDAFNKMLERENQTRIIIISFTIISLIITAIGLAGLIGHMAMQRRQEIAIRKVLGSSVWQILMIFGKRFIILIFVGFALSTPGIIWLSDLWLANFEYKTTLRITDIIFSTLLIVILTLLVVSRQAVAAAIVNPVKVLRNE